MSRDRPTGGRAIVAARDTTDVTTAEIERLARTAGFEVIDRLTQRRQEDLTYNLGAGKARELADRASETDADAVVFDGRLTPGQYGDLRGLLPPDTRLIDRYRLVLEIFAEGAGDRRAQLQVELATLEYRLPRLRQTTDTSLLNHALEKGSPEHDVEARIDKLRGELQAIRQQGAERRQSRREQGFDLVALAGYTNAGKSTLLHRLADELAVEDRPGHADETGTATRADQLFETLETTTRRATLAGRRTLVTDTVGLIDELPHELVESFSATLGEIRDSDVVIAVIDASAPVEQVRRRVGVTLGTLTDGSGVVVPALNKVDRLDEDALAARQQVVAEEIAATDGVTEADRDGEQSTRAEEPGEADESASPDDETDTADGERTITEPVAISALNGTGIEELRERVTDALASESVTLRVPNTGETQRFVAWCHDHGQTTVTYDPDQVRVSFTANPTTVTEARRRAERIE